VRLLKRGDKNCYFKKTQEKG